MKAIHDGNVGQVFLVRETFCDPLHLFVIHKYSRDSVIIYSAFAQTFRLIDWMDRKPNAVTEKTYFGGVGIHLNFFLHWMNDLRTFLRQVKGNAIQGNAPSQQDQLTYSTFWVGKDALNNDVKKLKVATIMFEVGDYQDAEKTTTAFMKDIGYKKTTNQKLPSTFVPFSG